jgi:hypothetical protein
MWVEIQAKNSVMLRFHFGAFAISGFCKVFEFINAGK